MNKNQILAAGDQYHIKFWDMDNASLLDICNAEGGLPCTPLINFNIEGNLLAVSTNDNRIKILATSDGMKLLHTGHGLGASRITANSVAKVTKITEGLAMKALANKSGFGTRSNLLQKVSPFANKSSFRILLSGNPRSGQSHLASCILHCFVGNVEIRKVNLATILQEGHGDVVQGVTQILTLNDALKEENQHLKLLTG